MSENTADTRIQFTRDSLYNVISRNVDSAHMITDLIQRLFLDEDGRVDLDKQWDSDTLAFVRDILYHAIEEVMAARPELGL